jgi:single-strand DNA-binding protein
MYLNRAMIIGNLTRDPELKALPSGSKVTSFSVATNRVFKDAQGQKKEQTDFHNIVVFGRQAETAAQYLKKGQSVLIEGRMQTRSWDGKDGEKKYRTEVIADRVQFGPKASGAYAGAGPSASGSSGEGSSPVGKGKSVGAEKLDTIEYPSEEINPEDIPF